MAKAKILQTEKEHHKQAFEFYYGLGSKRSYKAVAERFDVSASTIKNWSRSFRWRERIDEKDSAVTREMVDQTSQQTVEQHERNLKIVQTGLMRTAKDIAEGKVKVRMQDLERLMLLEHRLLSMKDSHLDVDGKPVPPRVVLYLPDNGRDKRLPKSGKSDPSDDDPDKTPDS